MTSEHDKRPRPQYGEYAEHEAGAPIAPASDSTPAEPSSIAEPAPAPAPAPLTTAPAATPSQAPLASAAPGRLPGVPHNLGVKGDGAAAPARAPQLGEPYRASDPAPPTTVANPEAAPIQATPPAPTGTATPARPRAADRIITVALLVLGGYFALSMAFSLSQLPSEFAKIAGDLKLADFTAPPQVQTIGTIGAILVLSLYALVLIFSIRRLRARKLTFWAPLAAGVLAWVLFFVLFAVSLGQSTELWQELMQVASDPEKAQQLLDQLSTRG